MSYKLQYTLDKKAMRVRYPAVNTCGVVKYCLKNFAFAFVVHMFIYVCICRLCFSSLRESDKLVNNTRC